MKPLIGRRVTLVPTLDTHVPTLLKLRGTREIARRWRQPEPGWPLSDPDVIPLTILCDERVVGFIQFGEEPDPDYRNASVDLFVDPEFHRRGFGRDAIATLARYLFDERNHHRLTIDPAADNTAAVRCYASVGFVAVGVMHDYERDSEGVGWHDGLLMELLRRNFPA